MKVKVKKAVFPVAGMGTRFLPATKANPKEMLPVVDKPLIQYAAEEAISAGIEELVFVTSMSKRAIEDHFDKNYELESELERRGKTDLLELVRGVVPEGIACVYVRQPEALGLGHAVLCAKPVIGDEPFAVILADDLIDGEGTSCLRQMVDASNLAVVGRYILTPRIFHHLEHTPRGAGGEIQLTDAIAALLKEEQVMAYQFRGTRYDCGSKLGYLMATVEYGLKHPELAGEFGDYLAGRFRDTASDKKQASG